MSQLIWIGLGGFLGAILRFVFSNFFQWISRTEEFPYGTIAVNVLGCLLIGFLSVLADGGNIQSNEIKTFLFVGLLGAFTTYSTFGNDSVNLFQTGNSLAAISNIGFHIILGIGAVILGKGIGETIF